MRIGFCEDKLCKISVRNLHFIKYKIYIIIYQVKCSHKKGREKKCVFCDFKHFSAFRK